MAEAIVGRVDWQDEVSGFCRCPGAALHTSATGKKDCRVNIDGAPKIYCFHASCGPVVAEANRRLRRELGDPAAGWTGAAQCGRAARGWKHQAEGGD
jgi:hypothetical protein